MKLNPIQRKVADLYANGEFVHLDDNVDTNDCGDTLFTFCINEAGDDCGDVSTYLNRLDIAVNQLQGLADDLLLAELNQGEPA